MPVMSEESIILVCGAGSFGEKGPDGLPRTEPIPVASPGKKGEYSVHSISDNRRLPVTPRLSWLSQYIHSAEIDYANNELNECLAKMHWIATLLGTLEQPSIDGGWSDHQYATVRQKLAAMTYFIDNGLDVFGRDRNYVPLASFSFYRQNTHEIIEHALILENELKELGLADKTQQIDRKAAQAAIEKVKLIISNKEQLINVEFTAINELQQSIQDLANILNGLWNDLSSASVDFKNAISTSASGCGFDNVLQFGMMVATVVSTAGAGVTVVASVGQAIHEINQLNKSPTPNGNWLQTMRQDIDTLTKVVKPAGQNIQQFKMAYQSAQKEIDSVFREKQRSASASNPRRPSNDYLKLIAKKEDFDREIEPFLNLPEARQYKYLMDLFVSTAETRNNKIVEHDEKITRVFGLWSEIAANRAEMGQISATLEYDFELPIIINYLDRALRRIKWDIAQSLTSLARTIEYFSLESVVIPIDDRNVASLNSSMAQVILEYQRVMESFGSSAVEAIGIKVPLADVLTEQQRDAILAGKSAVFSIRPCVGVDPKDPDPFYPRYAVTTLRISLDELPDDLKEHWLIVRFEHLGRSVMRDRNGDMRVYSHQPVRALFQTNIRGEYVQQGKLLDGSGDYVGVSPYGPWKLQFKMSDLNHLRKIFETAMIVFDVKGRVMPIS